AHRMAGLNPGSSFAHGAKDTESLAIVHGTAVKPERAARTETANPSHKPAEPMNATRAYAMGSLASMASGRAQSLEATSGMHGAHKEAGEAHLEAAAAHAAIGSNDKAREHKEAAAEHAAAAGTDWDETKHPRNERGEFT